MDLSCKANYQGPFDKEGIFLVDFGRKIGVRYSPISIAFYALGNYELYLRGEGDRHKEIFLKLERAK